MTEEFWEEAERWIEMNANGAIQTDSLFAKKFKEFGVDEDIFFATIEDNIFDEEDEDGEYLEFIDWAEVREDYYQNVALKSKT